MNDAAGWFCIGLAIGIAGTITVWRIDMRAIRKKGYDAGWVDRGISDWHKEQAKRNRLGQFRPKSERTNAH